MDFPLQPDRIVQPMRLASSALASSERSDDTFTRTDLLRIAGDFDDSDLPYLVDVLVCDKLSNQELKAHIDHAGKVLYP